MGFTEWLAEQGARELPITQRRMIVAEWTEAIGSLCSEVIQWLREDDPQHYLAIEPGKIYKAEEGLGLYEVDTLRILLGDRTVSLTPRARNVAGPVGGRGDAGYQAEGRVDLTNGAEKYVLYRIATDNQRKWIILDETEKSIKDLNKDSLELALQDLLS